MSESTTSDVAQRTAAPGPLPEAAPAPTPAPHTGTDAEAGTDTVQDTGAPDTGPRRRVLRTVGRWTGAVAVFGLLGAGTAFGITQQERTDVPGLSTRDDGRWDYPELTLPTLPPGAPRPFGSGNESEIHHGDVRDLLLPPPAGATATAGVPGIEGAWVPSGTFAKRYPKEERADIRLALTEHAVRHIAARGWETADGTRTSIYLLQFDSGAYPPGFLAQAVETGFTAHLTVRGSREDEADESWPEDASVPNVERKAFDEEKPRGATHVRTAYLTAGDVLAVIVQEREGTAAVVPFQQTVILQSQLLG
ncbi:hypothetical protein [Streptomyces sp. TR06-5]|uniref:hypothetical protein n=1 Tax=Streptomyces sp. TR06-5 TaxID=3385976 RepID=UPI0039A06F20